MRWVKRLFLAALAVLLVLVLSVWLLFLSAAGGFEPSVSRMERTLNQKSSELETVAAYLMQHDSSYIRWADTDKTHINYHYSYDDASSIDRDYTEELNTTSELAACIEALDARVIQKESNYVSFCYWSTMDASVCLLYCPDDTPDFSNMAPEYQHTLIALPRTHWFYWKDVYL